MQIAPFPIPEPHPIPEPRRLPSPPDVLGQIMVGAPRARLERFLSRLRRAVGPHERPVPLGGLRARRTAGGGRGKGRQRPAVRLPHVRSMRAQLDGHVVPDELSQDPAQWPLRRGARQRQLRGQAGHALRLGGGVSRQRAHCGWCRGDEPGAVRGRSAPARPVVVAARDAREDRRGGRLRQGRTAASCPASSEGCRQGCRAGGLRRAAVKFEDEPVPGYPLPILPGHTSPGRLERVLRAGRFAVTAELAPPDSADPDEVYRRARVFDGYVDAINATDGSGANCHMSSIAVCALLTRVGYAPIMQISCRDKNRIAIQGDILGGAAMGVCNMLCLTGDGVQAGDHPQAKPVFDLDCVSLLEIARTLRDEHRFQSGRKITFAPRVFFGAAENPSGLPHAWRAQRLAKKIAAGAQFIQTQYCYDLTLLRAFMEQVEALGLLGKVYILAGVGPLRSAKTAEWMRKNVPGMHVPDAIVARLAGAKDQAREGRNICIELVQAMREIRGISGVHIMAYRQEESVAEIVDRSGILQGRSPWYPERDAVQPIHRTAS